MIADDTEPGIKSLDQYLDDYLVRMTQTMRSIVGDKVFGISLFASSTILATGPMKVGFLESWRATNLCDKSKRQAWVFYNYVSRLSSAI